MANFSEGARIQVIRQTNPLAAFCGITHAATGVPLTSDELNAALRGAIILVERKVHAGPRHHNGSGAARPLPSGESMPIPTSTDRFGPERTLSVDEIQTAITAA